MLALFPDSATRRAGRARARRCAGAGARGTLRDTARRLLRGDAQAPGTLAARGGGTGRTTLLRHEGVRQRRRPPHPPRRGSRSRRRLRGRARLRASRRALGRRARRPRQQQGHSVPARGRGGARSGRAGFARRGGARSDRRRRAGARPGHARSRRGHTRGRRDGAPRIEVRPPSPRGTRTPRGCARPEAGRARAARARRLAAARLHRAGRDDPPARRVRRNLSRRARLGSPRRRPRGRLRDPPHPRR